MARIITVAAAQLGPIQRAEPRSAAVGRMVRLMERAHARGAQVVVFPELALTTFFPRHYLADRAEADLWFEAAMPSAETAPLFEAARRHGIAFHLGYAERTPEGRHFNTAILVNPAGEIMLKYRKVHLPGHAEHDPTRQVQHLEKRYFEVGDLGFPVVRTPLGGMPVNAGLMICNDRRWPEAWRCLGLQGVEMVLVGYNSAAYDPNGGTAEDAGLRTFHSRLAAQANAYMNATWAVAVAKAGNEDGSGLIGGTCIVDPNGLVAAEAATLGDELVVADCDLDACRQGKEKMFNFAAHRRPEQYRRIVDQVGALPPPSA